MFKVTVLKGRRYSLVIITITPIALKSNDLNKSMVPTKDNYKWNDDSS